MSNMPPTDLAGDGAYHRPNQNWVCGRLAEGKPCPVGPDRRGRCRMLGECEPRLEGARWFCTRAASHGGPCSDGPRPDGSCGTPIRRCQPVRSLRALRGAAARWAVVMTIGVLALILGQNDPDAWLSPGGLSIHHGQIENCGGCHGGFAAGPVRWVHRALSGLPKADEGDGKLCLACHEHGDQPFAAHGLGDMALASLTEAVGARFPERDAPLGLRLAAAAFNSPMRTPGGVACTNCHGEHAGPQADLTELPDARCQSCHAIKFDAFGSNHPPFDGYPYDRRTRINFDHARHIDRHFADARGKGKVAPETCAACHVGDAAGERNLLRGFEATCAGCHDEEVRGIGVAGALGLPVFTVPGLDVETLREKGIAIGAWPELAEGRPTPFMRLLLAHDEATAGALARFAALNPLDLREASAEDLAAVKAVAWATKTMVHDLLAMGPGAFYPALERQLGDSIDAEARRDLLGGLSIDIARQAQRAWFANLADEVARHRAGTPVPIPDEATPEAPTTEAGDRASSDTSDILDGETAKSDTGDILDGKTAKSDTGDILDGEVTDSDSSDILDADESKPDASDGLGQSGDGDERPAEKREVATVSEPVPESWSDLGGWYVDGFAIWYRPTGHADPFLRAWLTSGARHPAATPPREVFETLVTKTAPGKCAKCHAIDALADGSVQMNWRGKQSRPGVQSFTRFAHAPHFAALDSALGCGKCHRLQRGAAYGAAFESRQPHKFKSNFAPIGQEVCAECHTPTAAGNGCTICHDYHVGNVATKLPPTRLEAVDR